MCYFIMCFIENWLPLLFSAEIMIKIVASIYPVQIWLDNINHADSFGIQHEAYNVMKNIWNDKIKIFENEKYQS
jgi:hypothetical protein